MSIKDTKNIYELKQELLEELDDFLVDENLVGLVKTEKKKKALEELDKLIKQDLSYPQILSALKKDVKEEIVTEPKANNSSIASPSNHVLDLRSNKNSPKSKESVFKKYQGSWQRTVEKINNPKLKKAKTQQIVPKEPTNKTSKIAFYVPAIGLSALASRLAVFVLVLAVILMPIRALVFYGQIKDDKAKIIDLGQRGMLSLESGVILASENSYQEAQSNFDEALDNFSQARQVLDEYHKWMLNAAGVLPIVGKPISLSSNMLNIASNISEAAGILSQKMQNNESPTDYIAVLNTQIDKTLPYLEKANKDLDGISSNILPANMQVYFDSLKDYLPSTIESLKSLNQTFDTILPLLGHDAEKRYLVLFQNNHELRPTGGFVGSFAMFDVYRGKIVNLDIPEGGLYDLEAGQGPAIKAPDALSLINSHFNIWDANWWYDFPSSAKKITWFYNQAGQSSIDGVIAINADVLQDLLAVLGPIRLDGYNLTIDQFNVFEVLQEEVELNYDKEENKPKAVVADLVPIVLERLLSNTEKQKEIVSVLVQTLAKKDIQIYSNHPDIQSQIADFGWAGQALSTNRDYLAVINTNIGGGKTDNYIYQTIDHQAEIMPNGEIIDTVRITRSHRGDKDNPFAGLDGGNFSYIRVYTPLGSDFIQAIGFDSRPFSYIQADNNAQLDPDIAQEEYKMIDSESSTEIFSSLDKTVFAGWTALKPGETKTVSIKYKLPFKLNTSDPLINDWWQKILKKDIRLDNYSLLVQSQSGLKNNIFYSSILLPNNLKVIFNNATDSDSLNITNDLITYSTELVRDQYFGFIVASK
ncbi:DUF4012 domain-containing protein [Patescibacteria group bacterium]|nr:DUF4012 domain-containing protein [Patescibacteria group bacterium]